MDVWDGTDITFILMGYLIAPQRIYSDPEQVMETRSYTVFLLCLMKVDLSLRTPQGMQALHILFFKEWSAEFSPHFIDLAYILIHFGGADISAVDDYNMSPTALAFLHGWRDEWVIVLDRCGLDHHAVLQKEMDRLRKIIHLGSGESTSVDTEDLIFQASGDVTRRRAVVGDRLDD